MKRSLSVVPPELIALDAEEPCPYLPNEVARRPLRVPLRRLSGAEFDARLEAGDRRSGIFLYHQECPHCVACEPLRLDVDTFVPSETHRRTLRRGDRAFEIEVGPTLVDDERVALFDAHRIGRGLDRGSGPMDGRRYREFLVDSIVDSMEVRAIERETGRLAAVAVTDRGERSLSAVYTTWRPEHARLSLGTFMILRQLALAKQLGKRWLYLGLAIEASPVMRYKLGFVPHERRVGGVWRTYVLGDGGLVEKPPQGEVP